MKKIIVLLVLGLTLPTALYAQCGTANPALLRKLAGRELIVIMEQPSQKVIELLKKKKKKAEADEYVAAVAGYNEALRQAVQQHWPWDSTATYLTMNEADRLRKTQAKNHVVVYCTAIDNFTVRGDAGGRNFNRLYLPDNLRALNLARDHWQFYTALEIKFLEDLAKSKPIFRLNLPNVFPEKADLNLGLQAVQHYLADSTLRPRPEPYAWDEVLPQPEADMYAKTLLLRKDWLAPGLTHTAIKQVYPYPFVIVDGERFNESAARGNPNLALLQIVPEVISKKQKIVTNYLHAVLDSETGVPLGHVMLKADDGKDKYISRDSMRELAQYFRRHPPTPLVGNK